MIPWLADIAAPVLDLARETGLYQLRHFRLQGPGSGRRKPNRHLVSDIDIRSEELIAKGLLGILPEATIYGEETIQDSGAHYTWTIDPIDGTTNFLSGIDEWAIAIALLDRQHPVFGIVYKPFTDEAFLGGEGLGAYHEWGGHRHKLPRWGKFHLAEAVVGTGFPLSDPERTDQFFGCAKEVLGRCRGIRRSGSAALDLCHVAAGHLQAFWESGLHAYDVAASLVIAAESGCDVTDFLGRPYRLFESQSIVAGPRPAQRELQETTARFYGDYA